MGSTLEQCIDCTGLFSPDQLDAHLRCYGCRQAIVMDDLTVAEVLIHLNVTVSTTVDEDGFVTKARALVPAELQDSIALIDIVEVRKGVAR